MQRNVEGLITLFGLGIKKNTIKHGIKDAAHARLDLSVFGGLRIKG